MPENRLYVLPVADATEACLQADTAVTDKTKRVFQKI